MEHLGPTHAWRLVPSRALIARIATFAGGLLIGIGYCAVQLADALRFWLSGEPDRRAALLWWRVLAARMSMWGEIAAVVIVTALLVAWLARRRFSDGSAVAVVVCVVCPMAAGFALGTLACWIRAARLIELGGAAHAMATDPPFARAALAVASEVEFYRGLIVALTVAVVALSAWEGKSRWREWRIRRQGFGANS